MPLELSILVPDVLEKNLPSVLHRADERPETVGPTLALPEFPVCVKGMQEETLQAA